MLHRSSTVAAVSGVYAAGRGKWRVVVEGPRDPVTGRRRQVVRMVHGTKREAIEARARLIVDAGTGGHAGSDSTVAQLVAAWLADATHLAATTRRDYRSTIERHLPAAFGAMAVHRVRASDIDAVYRSLRSAGVGAERIRRLHTILSRSFARAVKWGWIARSPVTDATPPPTARRAPEVPTADEVRTLLAAAEPDLATWMRLEASLGARRGEVVGLRWSDIDLERGVVAIRRALADGGRGVGIVVKATKTGRERVVAIDAGAVTALREHRRRAAERALAVGATLGPDAWVFALDAAGMVPWRPDSASHRFDRLRRSVGLSHVQLKNLRHFVATQLLAAGVDPVTVSARLGHGRTSTTLDIYAAAVPARDRDAADELGRLLG